MSKDSCTYHQTRPACWSCEPCARDYCNQCVVLTEADASASPRCALCGTHLGYLGAGNSAKPFWSVAHRFFAYPFCASGIAFMALIGALSLLIPAGLLGLFVLLLTVSIGVKYCFAVLEAVAMGADRPPTVSEAVGGDEEHLFLKFLLVLIAVGFLQAVAEVLVHPALGTVFGVLTTFALPAMIVLLAVEKTLGAALSPARVAHLIFRIGWPYALAVFLTNVISTGPYLIAEHAGGFLASSSLGLPLFAALMGYFSVVNFAMLGYLIFEHQGDLGYVAGNPEDERLAATAENRRQQLLGEVNVLVKEGRSREALDRLHARRDDFAADMTFHQRHCDLALQGGDAECLARAADPCLELLMTRDGTARALELWRQAVRREPTYRPANPSIAHSLAERAHAANLPQEALALLVNLHKRAPDYEDLGGAYGLAAELLREQGQEQKAEELVKFTRLFLARRAQAASPNLTLSSLR